MIDNKRLSRKRASSACPALPAIERCSRLLAVAAALHAALPGASALDVSRRALLLSGASASSTLLSGRVETLLAEQSPFPAVPTAESGGVDSVTESPLGVSIRKAVVRGAQSADALDAKWDAFSFNVRKRLGDASLAPETMAAGAAARSPPPRLDGAFGDAILEAALGAAADTLGARPATLRAACADARARYAPIFEEKSPTAALRRDDAGDREAFTWRLYSACGDRGAQFASTSARASRMTPVIARFANGAFFSPTR
jgi:hypothetical protein